ncbi:MAG TPA: tetratricopeptide repeat protein [Chloroflexia bacterium]|nr:tetratricopeptide repeat protein [Chloroflexia bacterium]
MPELPTGTVTFLFTDIEGSTKRWEQFPDAMPAALARHDAIVRGAIAAHGGAVFQTAGDSFLAAFPTAPATLAAALQAQRTLQHAAWEGPVGALRVRMALNTGVAEIRDGVYHAEYPLNRLARLLSAGYGSQILLAGTTADLLHDSLPNDVELRDLGERRLKDLIGPMPVWQIVTPDLPSEFPPLKTLDARPNNLPIQPTPFLGREAELASAQGLLHRPDLALLTFTGPPGSGKTRLSLQLAANLLDDLKDGVFFVDFAGTRHPILLASILAGAVGAKEAAGLPLLESLKDFIHGKHLLLVLDGIAPAAPVAPLIASLLEVNPRLKILATSGGPVALESARAYPIPPLAVPNPWDLPPLDPLARYEAIALFSARAQTSQPDFQVTEASAPIVAEICYRLGGMPLAIELAAMGMADGTPDTVLQQLAPPAAPGFATNGAQDPAPSPPILDQVLAWSYQRLDPPAQTLLQQLTVFVGGGTGDAITAVLQPPESDAAGAAPPDAAALPGADPRAAALSQLVTRGLVRQEGTGPHARYTLLEPIRAYAEDQLAATGAAEALHRQHAAYYLALAEATTQLAGRQLLTGYARLAGEQDNLRAALAWALDSGALDTAARLSGALRYFWTDRGYWTEGRYWLDAIAAAADSAAALPPAGRAHVLEWAARLALRQGDYPQTIRYFDESLSICRQLDDRAYVSTLLEDLGDVALYTGDYPRAQALFEERLGLEQELGHRPAIVAPLANLAAIALYSGDYAAARTRAEEARALAAEAADPQLGATTRNILGSAVLLQGDAAAAQSSFAEALVLAQQAGDRLLILYALAGVAGSLGRQGHTAEAARLFGAFDSQRSGLGRPLPTGLQALTEQMIAETRTTLDAATWATAWTEGQALTLEAACRYAIDTVAAIPA